MSKILIIISMVMALSLAGCEPYEFPQKEKSPVEVALREQNDLKESLNNSRWARQDFLTDILLYGWKLRQGNQLQFNTKQQKFNKKVVEVIELLHKADNIQVKVIKLLISRVTALEFEKNLLIERVEALENEKR